MINKSIEAITGKPLCLSKGHSTQKVSVSGPSACGCGPFSPRAGANKQGKYIVDGVQAYGSGGGSYGKMDY